ncbi:hypothetical protein B0H11DRAFT_2282997 [Mycena galericulata]|nr:hypothetical protein B0H11DRAFT_2282997 [Mycena galericulata]
MASDDSLTPKIPPELERYIFELCALADRSGIPSLLRVAHRVHVWIEPLLYHALVLDYSQPCRLTPADSRDAAFLASHVKHLNLTGPMPHDQLCALLAACTGTTNLALWVPTPLPDLLPFLQALTLTRLSADTTHLFGGPLRVNFAHPALRALTHLDILAAGFDDWRLSAGLATGLPHLTHLAFRDKFHPHVLRGALAHFLDFAAPGQMQRPNRRGWMLASVACGSHVEDASSVVRVTAGDDEGGGHTRRLPLRRAPLRLAGHVADTPMSSSAARRGRLIPCVLPDLPSRVIDLTLQASM